ncbi:MAG: hypothetical protein R6U98_23185 [Pirellulaceae bacterium]
MVDERYAETAYRAEYGMTIAHISARTSLLTTGRMGIRLPGSSLQVIGLKYKGIMPTVTARRALAEWACQKRIETPGPTK